MFISLQVQWNSTRHKMSMFNLLYNFIPLFITIISELIQTATKSFTSSSLVILSFLTVGKMFAEGFCESCTFLQLLLKFVLFFQSPFSSHPTKQYPINLLLRKSSPKDYCFFCFMTDTVCSRNINRLKEIHSHNRRLTWKWDFYGGIEFVTGQAQRAVTEFSNIHSKMKQQN